jgi:NAD(P)-dependent dehydrogenase (short-subunit alcohol dehydrogenase family)
MHLVILTGASRGLGLAMARGLLAPGHQLLTMARQPSPALDAEALERGVPLEQWAVDLAEPQPIAERLRHWLTERSGTEAAQAPHAITLINNAAFLADPATLVDSDPSALSKAMRVSLEAPVLLSWAFLSATGSWAATRKVLNVSSGLGRWAMAGAASYCAAKAGLDHFTRSVALEEAARPNGARLVSLAPGVIATDMQVQLRSAEPGRFSERQRFVDLHAKGGLDTPEAAAAKVLAWLGRPDFGAAPVVDVREP